MKFWDTSALLPLLVDEPGGRRLRQLLIGDPSMLVWWCSRVEIASAIARREREGRLKTNEANVAFDALQQLALSWEEIAPYELIRDIAQRLLRTHPLRAADSLQLAAALLAADGEPATLDFMCLDNRLNEAARREGFKLGALT